MFDYSRQYAPKEILLLADAFNYEEQAKVWLDENDFEELLAFYDCIENNNDEAFSWMLSHGYFNLTAFVSAVANDEEAFFFLIKNDYKAWAAMASLIHQDKKAGQWLRENHLYHYLKLARALRKKIHVFLGHASVSGFGGGGIGSGVIGGFGGGSFGGGGAGGSW
jgi:uncharacterized membrane protein YgcG